MPLIDGVMMKHLKPIPDERGRLMEILRIDDAMFTKFGQVYMTTAYPGVVKAWRFHKNQTDHMTVLKGMMKVVLYDGREDSPTHGMFNEFFIGDHNPLIVKIPQRVAHGFKCISESESIALNIVTEAYNHKSPDEFKIDPYDNKIDYDWNRKDG